MRSLGWALINMTSVLIIRENEDTNIKREMKYEDIGRKRHFLCPLCKKHRRCEFNPWVRKIPWRRKWQPIPVFLPGESHGQRNLMGYSPWGRKDLDTTKQLNVNTIIYTYIWTIPSELLLCFKKFSQWVTQIPAPLTSQC